MASVCSFHSVVGIQNATHYVLEPRKMFWKMDGFVPVSLDTDNDVGDLPISIFIFSGKNAPPEDGIYFKSMLV